MGRALEAWDDKGWGEGTRSFPDLDSAITHWSAPVDGTTGRHRLADRPLTERIKASLETVRPAHLGLVSRCLGLDGRALPPAVAAAQEGVPPAVAEASLDSAMAAIQLADGWPGHLRDMLVSEPRRSLDELCDEPWARSMPETSVVAILRAVSRVTGTPLGEMMPAA